MASFTINTTSAQDARIISAYGKYLGLVDGNGDQRNATGAEVKAAIINGIRQVVFDQERTEAVAAITINPIDPT